MAAKKIRLALLTELGRALGATATSETGRATKRALPAHLYYDAPLEPRQRRPSVSLDAPTRLDREAWELARRGDEDRLFFILSRERARKARKLESQPAPRHDPLSKMVELQDSRVREILAAIPGGSWGGQTGD